MFMAGAAMAYSLHRQQVNGVRWSESFVKVLKRSAWLFFFGVLDYAVRPDGSLGVWGFGCGLLEWEFVAWVYMESG